MDERVYHYVKRNETTKIPRRHIVMDTEARTVRTKVGREQTWRLGVAHFIKADKGERLLFRSGPDRVVGAQHRL